MPVNKQQPDDLYLLIKSLTGAEKRYFRLYAQKESSDNSSYLDLFDIINEMNDYSLIELRRLVDENRLQTDLNKTKQYLFDSIIKALALFYANNDIEIKLKFDLIETLILNKKNLPGIAGKKIKQLEKNAKKHYKAIVLTETYILLKRNIINLSLMHFNDYDIDEVIRQQHLNLEILNEENTFRDITLKIKQLINSSKNNAPEDIQKSCKKMLKLPELSDRNIPVSYVSLLIYYSVKWFLKMQTNQLEGALTEINYYIELMNQQGKLTEQDKFNYITGFANKGGLLIQMNRFKDAEKILPLIKAVECDNQLQEMLKFRVYYTNYVELYSLLKLPEKIISIFPEMEQEIILFKGKISEEVVQQLYFAYAKALFETDKVDKSIILLSKIISSSEMHDLPKLSIAAKIQMLMCHYVKKNYDILPSMAMNINKQMAKLNFKNTFDYQFVKCFNRDFLLKGNQPLLKFATTAGVREQQFIYSDITDFFSKHLLTVR